MLTLEQIDAIGARFPEARAAIAPWYDIRAAYFEGCACCRFCGFGQRPRRLGGMAYYEGCPGCFHRRFGPSPLWHVLPLILERLQSSTAET